MSEDISYLKSIDASTLNDQQLLSLRNVLCAQGREGRVNPLDSATITGSGSAQAEVARIERDKATARIAELEAELAKAKAAVNG